MNIYGMRNDGTWARFQSEDGVQKYKLMAFRGYFEANSEAPEVPDASPSGELQSPAHAPKQAPAAPGTYRTLFQNTDQQGTSSGEDVSFDNLRFEGVIPYIENTTTGVQPTIVAIDADGTCRYFDLQGRYINGQMPNTKSLIIKNGKKYIIK